MGKKSSSDISAPTEELYSAEPTSRLTAVDAAEQPFGDEASHDIKYRTLSWPMTAGIMISEIVSNGTLSLPQSIAVVGLVPGIILIVFLGVFALFTAWQLIEFKKRFPNVHSMGDAGMILFGPIGREVLLAGTIIFAIAATSGQLLAGQLALSFLSDNAICSVYFVLIFAVASVFVAVPRTMGNLRFLTAISCLSILVAGIIGMVGAGVNPVPGRVVKAVVHNDFYTAFLSITSPVFSYAGHFLFFVLISEMRNPNDAMKAAWALQGFATVFYVVFAIVMYVYIGDQVQSPAFGSLPKVWGKIAYGLALPNFLICGAVYVHVAAKIIFTRVFRKSRHLHSHTVVGWGFWVGLVFITTAIAFILAVAVPVFSYLIGVIASVFASWYTFGLGGFFILHLLWYGWARSKATGIDGWRQNPIQTTLAFLCIIAALFICVAGTYVTIKLIADAYSSGLIGTPFQCAGQ
ncbi:hypothetical protein PYCC9005_003443 [Savitreella phatthalungensis]